MTDGSSSPSSADEQIAAHARAAYLVGLPWPERLRVVRQDRSYSGPSFIELAVGVARDVGMPYAEREEWARLAVEAARLGTSRRAEQLEPLAWAVLGHTLRMRGRLEASRAAIMRCQAVRHRLGDRLELAETLAIEAGYWWQILELRKAADLNREALNLARHHAADSVIGCYEVQAGSIANEAKDSTTAITMLLGAVDRIDPTSTPRLAFVAGQNLACSAIVLGHLDSAMCAMLQLRRRFPSLLVDIKTLLKSEWVIADIEMARGQWREAEVRLSAVREDFTENRLFYDAAQVDFEIAVLAAKTGRWPSAAHHAERAARSLTAAGSPREAWAATRLLREAVARRRGAPG
jgi:tetratricopeptide (TPR) repeat protein